MNLNIHDSYLGTWLDFMYGSCYYPCQTRPTSALVGLRGYRMGYLLHPHGGSSFLSVEMRGISSFEITHVVDCLK